MSSNDGYGSQLGDSDSFGGLTALTPPWPYVTRMQQTYAEQNCFEEGATIHFERLPPLPFWANILSDGEKLRCTFILKKVLQTSRSCERRLTATEVDAATESASRSAYYLPMVKISSLVAASYFAWAKRKTFRFPFYTPKSSFKPGVFPTDRFPLIRGPRAHTVWHSFRIASYVPFTFVGFAFFYDSLAETTFEARLVSDPRLKPVVADIKKANVARIARVRQIAGVGNYSQGPGAGASQSSQRFPSVPQTPNGHYSSESGNQAPRDYEPNTYNSQSEYSFSRPSAGLNREATTPAPRSSWPQTPQPQVPGTTDQKPRYPESSSQEKNDDLDLFDDDDDASPVPLSVRIAEAQKARNAQGGSAWDRIRQESKSGSSRWVQGDSSGQEKGWAQLRQDKAHNSRDGQPKTEGFAYTTEDEDREKRNYEKEQAQKEFDALLEAERRGGSGGR
ncbi:hypothetical protein F4804DRAFT_320246 [Jackrogersella minutella]|nr:hypothetical protein F4804DRAFT_320246 [Jackrogersella minutella]